MLSSGTLDDAQTEGSLVGSAPNGNTSGRQLGIGGFESFPHDFPPTFERWALPQFGQLRRRTRTTTPLKPIPGRRMMLKQRGHSSIGAAVAQHLDMVEVTGSNPVSTIAKGLRNLLACYTISLPLQDSFMRGAVQQTARGNSESNIDS
jgi:hypothetical protein